MLKIEAVKNQNLDYGKFVKRTALESDFSTLINEPCAIFENGELKVIYAKLDMNCDDLVQSLKKIKYQENDRTSGLRTTSRIFGYMPRRPIRGDFCHIASLSEEDPSSYKTIIEYAKKVASLYAKEDPAMYKIHEGMTLEKVIPEYRIPETPFTSGIINKNNPLKYHFDSGNFKKVYSCMLAFKHNVGGGYLALPEYDLGLEIASNSVLIFDGQKILHGVTPIRYFSDDAYRYTMVFYSLQQMWKCLPLSQEIARIRNLKMERERKRLPESLGEGVK